ncbi:hypothetical protein M406DRAFT_220436, partial [Cryphonectria parasitica EP155]
MHYIRLMRPPSLDERNRLKLVLIITTDLGDSLLCPDEPVPISVYVFNHDGGKVRIDDGRSCWRAGMRVLKLDLPIPAKTAQRAAGRSTRIRIVASRELSDPPDAAEVPFDTEGRILGLSVPFPKHGQEACYTATRELMTGVDGTTAVLEIEEEMGESIDRHVWDAGVVTTGLFLEICSSSGEREMKWRRTPLLREMLHSVSPKSPLHIVELGCGVGILGIGLARALSGAQSPTVRVLLTDLPDAEELARNNIILSTRCQKRSTSQQDDDTPSLDFESLDWEDGKTGALGPQASAISWDLIIISDCTYNVDMLSALVRTLSALHKSSVALAGGKGAGPKVMLATKPRHSSEKALFDLMKADRWDVLESASQPLPLLGLEDEQVEIYLF